jgi:hypothetical protein
MRSCHRSLIVFLLLVLTSPAFPQTKSAKRGVAYGYNSSEDLAVLSKSVTWWYNWFHQPETTVINSYPTYGFDYVPMAWNGAFNKEAMRAFLSTHPDVKYILGWNEPNFKSQANMTPSQAAALWPDIEELADEFELEIVSPAVNYCDVCVEENGTTYTDPVKYLDDFFTACVGCRVDHIAIHSYMGNVSALQWYVGLFKKYNRPIWLTEFANWENSPTLQQQKNFLVGAVDYLENDPDDFRYAWFTGRHTGAPYIGLLENGQSGNLTELGDIYVNMPLHDPEHYQPIPARIEAETYNSMSGILLELTNDVSGFANVGYIEANDWLEYGITVPEDDTYQLSIRTAGNQNSSIQFLVDGGLLKTIPIPATGDWQVWSTIKETATLTAGQHLIRIQANSAGFNLNWFQLATEVVLANDDEERTTFNVYPNPTDSQLNIESASPFDTVELVNVLGEKKYQGDSKRLDLELLPPGTYFVRVISVSGKSSVEKVIKK